MTYPPDDSRIDLTAPMREICERLGLDPTYVAQLEIRPGDVTAELYLGNEGRCKGKKYIDRETGDPAMETLTFEVWA